MIYATCLSKSGNDCHYRRERKRRFAQDEGSVVRSSADPNICSTYGWKEMKKAASLTMVWILMVCCRIFAATPIVWVVPSTLDRVGPTDAPGFRTNAVIHAARGEFESFQVAIRAPSGGLTNVNFSVSKLVGPRGTIFLGQT
jgi:hypothetical protein